MGGMGGSECGTGLACNMGTCGACGAAGEPCCANRMCTGALVCAPSGGGGNDACQQCGAATQPCCANQMCNADAGLTCMQGRCM
jgi:hypothetical protein